MSRVPFLIAVVAVAFVAGICQAENDTPEIKQLLNERREVLRKVVKGRQDEYRLGRCPLGRLILAYRELQQAELAAASTPEEKATALENLFKLVCEQDDVMLGQFNQGLVSVLDCYTIRAERLSMEIALRRAGGKPPKDVKPAREIKMPEKVKEPVEDKKE
jgi:hypothetical protein